MGSLHCNSKDHGVQTGTTLNMNTRAQCVLVLCMLMLGVSLAGPLQHKSTQYLLFKRLLNQMKGKQIATREATLISRSVTCPGGVMQCPDRNSCCGLPDGSGYQCCPLPDAVCCEDGVRCCPNGYQCGAGGECFQ